MTHATVKLAVIALPFGLLILAVAWLLRCRHRRELLSADAGGAMGLRCAACGRTRPHPWSGEPARHHRVQPATATGIEREARRQAAEAAEISTALAAIERAERRDRARLRVVSRYGGNS